MTLDTLRLMEHLPLGQRVQAFRVEARVDGAWVELGRGTTVGRLRLLPLPRTTTDALRAPAPDPLRAPRTVMPSITFRATAPAATRQAVSRADDRPRAPCKRLAAAGGRG